VPELPAGLVRWARLTGPEIVLDAVRERARRGHATERGTLRLDLAPDRRREVARLLGTEWGISDRPVTLQRLAAKLAEDGFTVREFVELLDARPLVDEPAARRALAAAAAQERRRAAELITALGITPDVAETWSSDQGLPRPGDGRVVALAEDVVRVWRHLPWPSPPPHRGPTRPPIRLATLAGTCLHNSHALDHDMELGRAVVRLIAAHAGLPRPVGRGREWRSAWATAGVLCDEVSSRVLVLNLPLRGEAAAVRLCAAAHGEPVWLTLRSLAGAWSSRGDRGVFICENPTVVEAAADALATRCPPLICTDGVPTFAALDLVGGLADAGAHLMARADVDDNGFVTVDQMRTVAPTCELWRFDSATYARHCGVADSADAGEPPLERLRRLYGLHRISLHEETLLDELISDLAAASTMSVTPLP
jgi:uncharacterized protein (TIGR02679 family)